jgi:predicted nuclease of predicted toxin-antitoxin system
MKLYLDDNRADDRLVQLLQKAGHDVETPTDAGLLGASDARHFAHAIVDARAILTNDRDDFRDLHQLVLSAGGQHPGVLVVRFERDSRKDMKPGHIVAALKNLEQAAVSCTNDIVVLNQWR